MQCSRCRKEAAIVPPCAGAALCTPHAALCLEARAKRRIRKCGGIASGTQLFVEDRGDAESFVLSHLLAKILADRRDISSSVDPADATVVMTADTLDDYACGFLGMICSGDAVQVLDTADGKIVSPLTTTPRNEVYLYARHHEWAGPCGAGPSNPFTADICTFLENFSADHPAAPWALVQVRDALVQLYQERNNNAV
ncbi:MAG: hypothetical protein LBU24_02855 [Methanocalculaceae archaeon]|nr:hypothetical protein [Methanocalculaceae archaeon]